jgi:hypothetical protein
LRRVEVRAASSCAPFIEFFILFTIKAVMSLIDSLGQIISGFAVACKYAWLHSTLAKSQFEAQEVQEMWYGTSLCDELCYLLFSFVAVEAAVALVSLKFFFPNGFGFVGALVYLL